jgi:hypothetical protein
MGRGLAEVVVGSRASVVVVGGCWITRGGSRAGGRGALTALMADGGDVMTTTHASESIKTTAMVDAVTRSVRTLLTA